MASQGKEKGGKSFKATLQTFESAAKDMLHFVKVIASVEDLQTQKKDLQRQLDDAGAEIKKLREKLVFEERKNDDLFEKLKQKIREWDKEKTKLKDKIRDETENDNLAAQRTIQQLQKQLEQAKESVKLCQRQEEEQKINNSLLQSSLENAEFRLKSLKSDIGVEEVNPNRIIRDFQNIEDRLEALTSKFFEQTSASPNSSELDSRMPHLRKNNFSPQSQSLIPFSYTNIICPRPLYAQSIIANRLSSDIFTPTCLPSPVGRMGLGEALERSSKLRPYQKAVLRSLSVTAFHTEEERLRVDMLDIAVSDLLTELEPLIQSQEAENLKRELRDFFLFATEIWKSLQKSPDWARATSNLKFYPDSWRYSDGHTSSEFPSVPSTPQLVLFPHIFYENGEQPLHRGLIWTDGSHSKVPNDGDGGSTSPILQKKEYARSEPGRKNGSSSITTVPAQIKETPENPETGKHSLERMDKRSVGGNGDGHGGTRAKRHANAR